MKIKKNVIEHICENVAGSSSETGGILGSNDGEIISVVIMDNLSTEICRCSYTPNIKFFNQRIDKWQKEKKCFMGIFHTHFYNIETLSKEDIKYINAIMKAMPYEVNSLFFPIYTLPQHKMICYEATREENNISIKNDILEII